MDLFFLGTVKNFLHIITRTRVYNSCLYLLNRFILAPCKLTLTRLKYNIEERRICAIREEKKRKDEPGKKGKIVEWK